MKNQNFKIRYALFSDASGIAAVHILAWQTAYRQIIPASFLDSMDLESGIARWQKNLSNPKGVTLVAVNKDQVRGWCSFSGCRDIGEEFETGEIIAIYVHPDDWGSGIGTELMKTAESGLIDMRFTRSVLWVLEENYRSQAFYWNRGYEADGKKKQMEIGGNRVKVCRFSKNI